MRLRLAREAAAGVCDTASTTTTTSSTPSRPLGSLSHDERQQLVDDEIAAASLTAVETRAQAVPARAYSRFAANIDCLEFVDCAKREVNTKQMRAVRRRKYGLSDGRSTKPRIRTKLHPVATAHADAELLDSGVFDDAEIGILSQLEAYALDVLVDDAAYQMCVRARMMPGATRTVLCLHGFGASCNYATWARLAPDIAAAGRNMIFADLPGFGRSSGRDIQTGTWRRHAPQLVKALVNAFGITSGVSFVGFCGGAATAFRAVVAYPRLFAGEFHLAHNSVIAAVPADLGATLAASGSRLVVTWAEDEDHTHGCVAYKAFAKLRKARDPTIILVDIADSHLPAYGAWTSSTELTRGTHSSFVFAPSSTLRALLRHLLAGHMPTSLLRSLPQP